MSRDLEKLQVGDQIRCTDTRSHECLCKGRVYTIIEGDDGGPVFKCDDDLGSPHPVRMGGFEIVSQAGPW